MRGAVLQTRNPTSWWLDKYVKRSVLRANVESERVAKAGLRVVFRRSGEIIVIC